MTWFNILKESAWTNRLSDKNKLLLEKKPKLDIAVPKMTYPKEETEIKEVLSIMQKKKITPKNMKNADLKPSIEMTKIVGASDKQFNNLMDDVNIIAMREKMKHKRKRPYEVSDKIKNPKTTTDDTPSFPSGHAMLAYALEKVLSTEYPNKKKELKEMADQISLSRIQMGSHYPSDIKAGKQLGYLIGEKYE